MYRTSSDKADLIDKLRRLEQHLETLELKILETNPKYSLLKEPDLCDTDAVQRAILNDHSVLIQFFVGKKDIFSWVITRKQVHSLSYENTERLKGKITDYVKKISQPFDQTYLTVSQEIYKELVKPLEQFLPKQTAKLIIIPDRVLYSLPFEALLRSMPNSRWANAVTSDPPLSSIALRYLIEDYEIAYAPSASVLRTLERIPRRGKTGSLLALGDPVYREKKWSRDNAEDISPLLETTPPETLAYSSQEILRIKDYVPGKKEVYLRDKATERTLKRSVGKGFKIIHMATHSVINEENAENSFILLTPDEDSSEDGLLRLGEIFNLNLEADLVVLASCRSGTGQLMGPKGSSDFPGPFFAPAPNHCWLAYGRLMIRPRYR